MQPDTILPPPPLGRVRQTQVGMTGAPVQLVPQNQRRRTLILSSIGTGNVFITAGNKAAATAGQQLAPGIVPLVLGAADCLPFVQSELWAFGAVGAIVDVVEISEQ